MSARPVARTRTPALEARFGKRRAVIGVIHARPLPGAPDYGKRAGVWWHEVEPERVAAFVAEVKRRA